MQAESLEVLEKANVPAPQARAIVRAIEIEIDGATDTLATKHDFALLRQEMVGTRHDLQSGTENVRGNLEAKIESVRTHLEAKIERFRSELEAKIESVRSDLELKIESLRGDLRTEIHKSARSIATQMYAALVGQLALLLGVAYFFVTHVTH